LTDLLHSHNLKDVKQKTEQIQNLLTGKNDSLTATISLRRIESERGKIYE
jgi:hypothetical protein